nr:uncharacterized protein LOC113827011 [Penaeus vannamei]
MLWGESLTLRISGFGCESCTWLNYLTRITVVKARGVSSSYANRFPPEDAAWTGAAGGPHHRGPGGHGSHGPLWPHRPQPPSSNAHFCQDIRTDTAKIHTGAYNTHPNSFYTYTDVRNTRTYTIRTGVSNTHTKTTYTHPCLANIHTSVANTHTSTTTAHTDANNTHASATRINRTHAATTHRAEP